MDYIYILKKICFKVDSMVKLLFLLSEEEPSLDKTSSMPPTHTEIQDSRPTHASRCHTGSKTYDPLTHAHIYLRASLFQLGHSSTFNAMQRNIFSGCLCGATLSCNRAAIIYIWPWLPSCRRAVTKHHFLCCFDCCCF